MGTTGTWVSMRPTSRPSWPTMRKRMVMVGRKTSKVSQVRGAVLSTIAPSSLHPCPAAAAFVSTVVGAAHRTLSSVFKELPTRLVRFEPLGRGTRASVSRRSALSCLCFILAVPPVCAHQTCPPVDKNSSLCSSHALDVCPASVIQTPRA